MPPLAAAVLAARLDADEALCRELTGASGTDAEAARFLQRGGALLAVARARVAQATSADGTAQQLREAVRAWAQGMLDVTFVLESRLVDLDFPDSRRADFDRVVDALRAPADVCDDAARAGAADASGGAMVALLGEELVETTLWRRGALWYMITVTIAGADADAARDVPGEPAVARLAEVAAHIDDGIDALRGMLGLRSAALLGAKAPASPVELDADAAAVRSTTHLLALAYVGELHHRRWRSCGRADDAGASRALLGRFVGLAEGPLAAGGWDTQSARRLLSALPK